MQHQTLPLIYVFLINICHLYSMSYSHCVVSTLPVHWTFHIAPMLPLTIPYSPNDFLTFLSSAHPLFHSSVQSDCLPDPPYSSQTMLLNQYSYLNHTFSAYPSLFYFIIYISFLLCKEYRKNKSIHRIKNISS